MNEALEGILEGVMTAAGNNGETEPLAVLLLYVKGIMSS
jgi:hypothetical protein